MADSFEHYLQAIEEVLVSGSAAAANYPIPVGTFSLDYHWDGQDLSFASDKALLLPQLAIRSEETLSEEHGFISQNDQQIYDVTVDVLMLHNLIDAREMKSARVQYTKNIQNDVRRIKSALEFSNNLSTTIAGNPTGLASGCLYGGTWTTIETDHELNAILSRIRFQGIVQVTLG